MRVAALIAALAVLACAPSALAGSDANKNAPPTPVDPSSVVVPDLSFKPVPKDADHYWEYFYFNRPGVKYEKAFADLSECLSISANLQATTPVPDFVPLGGAEGMRSYRGGVWENPILMQYGLVGGVVGSVMYSIIGGMIVHEIERANTRRCMQFKRYKRYGVSKAVWAQLTKGSPGEVTIRFALIASGPVPAAEVIEP
jgi:hypothetical protein